MGISTEKTINRQIAREYKNLLKVSYQTLNENDKDLIRNALDIAIDAHKDQYRKSGEPYIFHPISVAKIVAEKIGLDANSIAAALLHDVVEDSEYNIEKIKSVCGVGRRWFFSTLFPKPTPNKPPLPKLSKA